MLCLPDADDAGLYYFFFALFVAFVLFAILAEAVVMILMKYNVQFKKPSWILSWLTWLHLPWALC